MYKNGLTNCKGRLNVRCSAPGVTAKHKYFGNNYNQIFNRSQISEDIVNGKLYQLLYIYRFYVTWPHLFLLYMGKILWEV